MTMNRNEFNFFGGTGKDQNNLPPRGQLIDLVRYKQSYTRTLQQ
jgi:hypothetical protein